MAYEAIKYIYMTIKKKETLRELMNQLDGTNGEIIKITSSGQCQRVTESRVGFITSCICVMQ